MNVFVLLTNNRQQYLVCVADALCEIQNMKITMNNLPLSTFVSELLARLKSIVPILGCCESKIVY